jgi:hypothetical protein
MKHPPYGPDLPMYNFFLLINIKMNLKANEFANNNEHSDAFRQILEIIAGDCQQKK